MRRVGLIDITVGNAARLGASQRSTTRRCASHHIATQRASRRGHPGGSRAFSADGPPQAPVAPSAFSIIVILAHSEFNLVGRPDEPVRRADRDPPSWSPRWRITPEPAIGPRFARTRWAPIRLTRSIAHLELAALRSGCLERAAGL